MQSVEHSVIGVVDRMVVSPYTDEKYIYIRHFSVALLDSILGVCYKTAVHSYTVVRSQKSYSY